MTTLTELGGWPALFGALGPEASDSSAPAASAESAESIAPLLQAGLTEILSGAATDGQIGGFVMGLRARGERPAEIAALVEVMLEHSVPLDLGSQASTVIDIVGTGGAKTGQPAMNVSTIAS